MSIQPEQSGHWDIARQILAYLTEHPQARDTLEGIMHWWLLEQQIKYWTPQVQEALTELTAQGWLRESKGRDGRILYRVNRRKARRIQSMLERGETQPKRTSKTKK
ncbi:MAG TPA: hypothetical protein VIC84_09815 [Blastocatellia bacterium]|jgi:hypothetical protein